VADLRADPWLFCMPITRKFTPLVQSVEKMKNNILGGVRDEMWLREKVLSLEYGDGFDFRQFMKDI